jgi:hypothetical protein
MEPLQLPTALEVKQHYLSRLHGRVAARHDKEANQWATTSDSITSEWSKISLNNPDNPDQWLCRRCKDAYDNTFVFCHRCDWQRYYRGTEPDDYNGGQDFATVSNGIINHSPNNTNSATNNDDNKQSRSWSTLRTASASSYTSTLTMISLYIIID